MSDIKELLEREVRPLQAPDAWEPVHRRARQRRRHRRIGSVIVAFAVAVGGIGGAWLAVDGLRHGSGDRLPATGPAWDGGRIVYQCDMPPYAAMPGPTLCTMRPDGTDRRPLNGSPYPQWDAAWSPDGTRIAYRGYRDPGCDGCNDIFVMDADGSNVRRLTTEELAENPAWSPDGKTIVFDTSGRGSIETVGVDGRGVTRLTPGEDAGFVDSSPAWSPDGKEIAFVRSSGPARPDLYVMNADGTDVRPVVESDEVAGAIADPAWSPDGRFLAFAVESSSLWYWDGGIGGDPKNHPIRLWSGSERISNPEWIEGGAQVAFLRRHAETTDLVAVRFDGLDAPVHVEEQQGPDGTQPVMVGSGQPRTILADFPGEQFSFQPPPGGAAGACADPGPPQFISCAQALRSIADVPPSGSGVTVHLVRGSLRPGDDDRWVWAVVSHDQVSWKDPRPREGPSFSNLDFEVDVDAETGRVVWEGRARQFG